MCLLPHVRLFRDAIGERVDADLNCPAVQIYAKSDDIKIEPNRTVRLHIRPDAQGSAPLPDVRWLLT